MKRSIYFVLIIFTIVGCLLLISMGTKEKLDTKVVTINGINIDAEIADTQEARQTGLMNRKSMEDNHGMLFIFDRDQKLSFWMKNTYIPLSVAYVSSEGVIMEIHDMHPESLRPVDSVNSVRYALEMNQGWFEKNHIEPGDVLTW
ncbi:MAG: DUF192 domain-containing protein [Spirochaetales bacterium]|nr:DUF192 domain-containing protein [Spirochaetales bacterium]